MNAMRINSILLALLFALVCLACGDATEPDDTTDPQETDCTTAEDYRACVGDQAYFDEVQGVNDEVEQLNQANQDPAADDLAGCTTDSTTHFCNADQNVCIWNTHKKPNGVPYILCDCALEIRDEWRTAYCE